MRTWLKRGLLALALLAALWAGLLWAKAEYIVLGAEASCSATRWS